MCQTISRTYLAASLDVEVVGNFANAAVMSVLEPSDWQVSQDVRLAAIEMTSAAIGRGDSSLEVKIVFHADHLEVQGVTRDSTTRTVVRPRAVFATAVGCDLDPAHREG